MNTISYEEGLKASGYLLANLPEGWEGVAFSRWPITEQEAKVIVEKMKDIDRTGDLGEPYLP